MLLRTAIIVRQIPDKTDGLCQSCPVAHQQAERMREIRGDLLRAR